MMKKEFYYFFPLLFGLLVFLLYIAIYTPTIKSDDFITAVLVIFTGMGWSSVIVFARQQSRFLLFFYITVAIAFPMLLMLPFNMIRKTEHFVIVSLIALGIIMLKLFIAYYLRSEKKKKSLSSD